MGKIKSILKIAGAGFALGCGTVFKTIGIPLLCVGNHEFNEAKKGKEQAEIHKIEYYSQTEDYLNLKRVEEAKVDFLKVKFEEAEDGLQNSIITYDEYNFWKNSYENEQKYFENDFLKECYDKLENKPVLIEDKYWEDLYSTGSGKLVTGIIFTALGGFTYLVKLIEFITIKALKEDYKDFSFVVGLANVIKIEVRDLKEKAEEKKKFKEQEKIDIKEDEEEQEEVEDLTDTSDEYYRY